MSDCEIRCGECFRGARAGPFVLAFVHDRIDRQHRGRRACREGEEPRAHGKREEQLATDAEMYWHVGATYLEAGVMDESGREIGGLSWVEKLDITGDWLRRHPESSATWRKARYGSPLPRTRRAGSAVDRGTATGEDRTGRDVESRRFRCDDDFHSRRAGTRENVERRQRIDAGPATRLPPKRRNWQKHG